MALSNAGIRSPEANGNIQKTSDSRGLAAGCVVIFSLTVI